MSLIKLFTEKANHQALKALLCAQYVRRPLEVTLASTYSTPYMQLPSSKLPLYSPNEMVKVLLKLDPASSTEDAQHQQAAEASAAAATAHYARSPVEASFEEEEWLEWESNTLTTALTPLYTQRKITSELTAALKVLDAAIAKNAGRGVCAVEGQPDKVSFMVDSVMFAAVLPALCEGGLLPAKEHDALPALVAWFNEFQSNNEELLASACDSLSVQEPGDFLRVPRTYEVSPVLTKTFFATTPIYYVNAEPHIGHVYSTLIVDVLGRYHRVKGEKVHVMTGTDEHGLKVAEAARQKGMSPIDFTTQVSASFKECFRQMGYNMDYFIRTTMDTHRTVVQSIWRILEEKGDIYLGKYEGWYCVSDESFLTAQNVADGVDKNGNPCKVSLESGHPVTWVEEENYMFRLSEFRDRLLKYYHDNPNCIVPEFRRREVIRTVEKGLFDLSISRKRESVRNWSIPVPGNENHCIYVWLDALVNYYTCACTKTLPDGTDVLVDYTELNRWPADAHVVGKDILKFHAIYWPAFLMSAGLPLPTRLVAHGWWTKDHKKISKSLGNSFDPVEKANQFGYDALKYFLLRETNFADDGDYSDKNMVARLNGELADTLGNLVMRCLSPKINPKAEWPQPGPYNERDLTMIQAITNLAGTADHYYCLPDIQKALISIFDVLRALNGYVTENAPWKLVKSDLERHGTVLYVTMEGVRVCVTLLQPVLAEKSGVILDELGVPPEKRVGVASFNFGVMSPGSKIGETHDEVLFQKMTLGEGDSAPTVVAPAAK